MAVSTFGYYGYWRAEKLPPYTGKGYRDLERKAGGQHSCCNVVSGNGLLGDYDKSLLVQGLMPSRRLSTFFPFVIVPGDSGPWTIKKAVYHESRRLSVARDSQGRLSSLTKGSLCTSSFFAPSLSV